MCILKKFTLVLSLSLFFPSLILAENIPVNTFEDSLADDSTCSLREAVASANQDSAIGGCVAGSGADTIILSAGEYVLSIPCSESSDCGDLDITETLTLVGAGKSLTTIKVAPEEIFNSSLLTESNFRALDFKAVVIQSEGQVSCEESCSAGSTLTLKDLSFQDGVDYNGGAVRLSSSNCSTSSLELTNVGFANNEAGNKGGAVYVEGRLSATNVSFDNNIAEDDGGAVYLTPENSCSAESSIVNSVFTSNRSFEGSGGAIFSAQGSDLSVAGSEFSANNAYEHGGAIAADRSVLAVTQSELTGNGVSSDLICAKSELCLYSPRYGGAIAIGSFQRRIYDDAQEELKNNTLDISLLVSSSKISGNNALYGGGGIAVIDIGYFTQSGQDWNSCKQVNVASVIRDSEISDNLLGTNFNFNLGLNSIYPNYYSNLLGGGLLNSAFGKMTVETSTIDGNSAATGAGIANLFDLKVVKSTISNNNALITQNIWPGSLNEVGTLENDYIYTINYSGGGGLFNGGSADIENSTISGNKTDGNGAGVFNLLSELYVSVYDEQLFSLTAEDVPASTLGEPGTRMNNSTVANNEIAELEAEFSFPSALSTEGFYLNNGGGIATLRGSISLANTVVALNKDEQAIIPEDELFGNLSGIEGSVDAQPTPTATVIPSEVLSDFAPDCYAFPESGESCMSEGIDFCETFKPKIISQQFNLIGTNQGCSPFQPAANSNSDKVGTEGSLIDPLLGPLQNNGGDTNTHQPLKGSPLIDAANSQAIVAGSVSVQAAAVPCLSVDQRGVVRPLDGDNNGSVICDIGAVEVEPDCNGVPGGAAVVDSCGVCGGDGSSCLAPGGLSCKEQNIEPTLLSLDGTAHQLKAISHAASRTLRKKGGNKKTEKANNKIAGELFMSAWVSAWTVPTVVKSDCTGGVNITCVSVSTAQATSSYSKAINELYNLNNKIIAKLGKAGIKKTKVNQLKSKNDTALAKALADLATVPASSLTCS